MKQPLSDVLPGDPLGRVGSLLMADQTHKLNVLIVSEQSRLGRDTIRTLAPSSAGGALRQ
jgi:hypothetical protein